MFPVIPIIPCNSPLFPFTPVILQCSPLFPDVLHYSPFPPVTPRCSLSRSAAPWPCSSRIPPEPSWKVPSPPWTRSLPCDPPGQGTEAPLSPPGVPSPRGHPKLLAQDVPNLSQTCPKPVPEPAGPAWIHPSPAAALPPLPGDTKNPRGDIFWALPILSSMPLMLLAGKKKILSQLHTRESTAPPTASPQHPQKPRTSHRDPSGDPRDPGFGVPQHT